MAISQRRVEKERSRSHGRRNCREACRWQPLGAVQSGTALRAQCISRGASASRLTSLCRRGDVQSLATRPSALLARSESGNAPRYLGASNRILLPARICANLRVRLSSHRSLSATPL
eukprot:5139955-Pleurochrysis_carterae.AAC.1